MWAGRGSEILRRSVVRERMPCADPKNRTLSLLILHDNSLFKHLSNGTFIHSPVITSQTTGAITTSLCVCLFVGTTYLLLRVQPSQLQRALTRSSAPQSPTGFLLNGDQRHDNLNAGSHWMMDAWETRQHVGSAAFTLSGDQPAASGGASVSEGVLPSLACVSRGDKSAHLRPDQSL